MTTGQFQPVEPVGLPPAPNTLWIQIVAALLAADVLYILSGVFYAFAFSDNGLGNQTLRLRLETIATIGSSIPSAIFILGAVVVLLQAACVAIDASRLRPVFMLAFAIAVVVLLCSLYSVWHIATVKASTSANGLLESANKDWNTRLSQICPRAAAGALAACAMVLANRRAPLRVVESEPGEAFTE